MAIVAMLSWAVYSLNQLQQISVRQEERLISALSQIQTQDTRISETEEQIVNLRIKVDRLEQDR